MKVPVEVKDKTIIVITPYDYPGNIVTFMEETIRPLLLALGYAPETVNEVIGEPS